ncbi:Uncharacterized protein AC509_3286 [Pseudomonas amygdali pv. morsprunorum]|nr:Uncharacterized protein AC509_3286 [Pseudomonas amygdali pv. morsprunorum]
MFFCLSEAVLASEAILPSPLQAVEGAVDRLEAIIGHPLRTYEDFGKEATVG